MIEKLLIPLIITFSTISSSYCANFSTVTWKGIYYQAIPNQPGVSANYCIQHSPGSFIHTVKGGLAHPLITNKGIKLDHPQFHLKKENGIYLIHGSFVATGKTNNQVWKDHIHYYLYKLTDLGVTRGVWSTNKCKGLYKGIVIN